VAQVLIPDRPVAFGYKQVWLAVRDAQPQVVADALGLLDTQASTWKEGILWAYEEGYGRERRQHPEWQTIFVSPPVFGWTLAVGGDRFPPGAGDARVALLALPSQPGPGPRPILRHASGLKRRCVGQSGARSGRAGLLPCGR
jgi:hypothetical protein